MRRKLFSVLPLIVAAALAACAFAGAPAAQPTSTEAAPCNRAEEGSARPS